MLTHFRVQHVYIFFKKWRKDTLIQKELNRPDSIKGAQMQLDNFKRRQLLFDAALEKLHHEKPSQEDFEDLKQSIDLSRNQMFYNDMRDLVDVTASTLRKQIKDLHVYTFEKVKEIEEQHEEKIEAIRADHNKHFSERLATLEKQMNVV